MYFLCLLGSFKNVFLAAGHDHRVFACFTFQAETHFSVAQVAVTPKGEGAEEPSGKSVTFTLVDPAGACGAKFRFRLSTEILERHRDCFGALFNSMELFKG